MAVINNANIFERRELCIQLNLFFPNVWKLSTVRRQNQLFRELAQVPVTIKRLSVPALGIKHLSVQTVAKQSFSEMDTDGYSGFIRNRNPYTLHLSAIGQHSLWTLPSLLQAPQQLLPCLVCPVPLDNCFLLSAKHAVRVGKCCWSGMMPKSFCRWAGMFYTDKEMAPDARISILKKKGGEYLVEWK